MGWEESTGGDSRRERMLSSPLLTVLTKISWLSSSRVGHEGCNVELSRYLPEWSAPRPRRLYSNGSYRTLCTSQLAQEAPRAADLIALNVSKFNQNFNNHHLQYTATAMDTEEWSRYK